MVHTGRGMAFALPKFETDEHGRPILLAKKPSVNRGIVPPPIRVDSDASNAASAQTVNSPGQSGSVGHIDAPKLATKSPSRPEILAKKPVPVPRRKFKK